MQLRTRKGRRFGPKAGSENPARGSFAGAINLPKCASLQQLIAPRAGKIR
jgi:hypothetical protein